MQRVSEDGIWFGTYLWENGATAGFRAWAEDMAEALRALEDGSLPQDLADRMREIGLDCEEKTGKAVPFDMADPEALDRAIDAAEAMAYFLDRSAGDARRASISARGVIPDDLCIWYNYNGNGILAYMMLSSSIPMDGNIKRCPLYLWAEMDAEISDGEGDDGWLFVENHRADLEELDASIREKARILGIGTGAIRNSWLR